MPYNSRDFFTEANTHLEAQQAHPVSGPIIAAARGVEVQMKRELAAQRTWRTYFLGPTPTPTDDQLDEFMQRLITKLDAQGFDAPMKRLGVPGNLPRARFSKDGDSFILTVHQNLTFHVKEWDPEEAGSH